MRAFTGALEGCLVTVRGGKKRDLWQELVSSHWCTWSPGSGSHVLFVGMLMQQETLKFDNYYRVWRKTKGCEAKRI